MHYLVRLLGEYLSNGRNDVLVGVPYASSYEFTEFLFTKERQSGRESNDGMSYACFFNSDCQDWRKSMTNEFF